MYVFIYLFIPFRGHILNSILMETSISIGHEKIFCLQGSRQGRNCHN